MNISRLLVPSSQNCVALELLCNPSPSVATIGTESPASAPQESAPSYATEYKKHRDFFTQLDNFEVTYSDWYSFELKARRDILKGVLFDWDAYASEVLLRIRLGDLDRERKAISTAFKRHADTEPFTPNKMSRFPRGDAPPASLRSRQPFRSSSTRAAPQCLICAKGHSFRDHPTSSTSFEDGKPFFSRVRDNTLWTAKSHKGGGAKRICIFYNLNKFCDNRHGTDALHPETVLAYRDFSAHIHYRPRLPSFSSFDNELFERVVTPYNVSAFDRLLNKHNLSQTYPLLVNNLKHGFPLGTLPKLTKSVIIKNHPSVDIHPEAVAEYLATEISLGPEQDAGPGLPPKLRVCRNLCKKDPLSGTPSVNSFISKDDFPTRFDMAFRVAEEAFALIFGPSSYSKFQTLLTSNFSRRYFGLLESRFSYDAILRLLIFSTSLPFGSRLQALFISLNIAPDQGYLSLYVARAPPGTQAMSFDIKAFHRTCPALPDHKPFLVVSFRGAFYLDHVHPFGARPASSNSGQIANAFIDIWHAEVQTSSLFLKYEDDVEAFRFPVTTGPFREADLNIPWHPEKTDPCFSTSFTYIGFSWDLILRTVSLTEKKRQKYLARVSNMLNAHVEQHAAFKLRDIQVIHGTLVHVSFVYPEGSSRLPAFSNFMSGYKTNAFVAHHLSDSVVHALRWWRTKLEDPSGYRQLHPIRDFAEIDIFVDASTSWGLGIIIGEFWHAFKLVKDWKQPQHDICWLEAVAVELAISFLAQLEFSNTHILIHSDNYGAIGAHNKHRSPNLPINLCTRRTYTFPLSNTSNLNSILPTRSRVENRAPPEPILRAPFLCRANLCLSSMASPLNSASTEAFDVGLDDPHGLLPRTPTIESTKYPARTTPSMIAPGLFRCHKIIPSPKIQRRLPPLETSATPPRTTSCTIAPGLFVANPNPRHLAARSLPSHKTQPPRVPNLYTPSPYRPVVPADQRLLLWTTPHSLEAQNALNSQIPVENQSQVYHLLLESLSESTRQSYGAGLLRFTQFCDRLRISENLRMPASDALLSAFIADASSSCSGACVRNWLSGLRAWHIIHRAEWHGRDPWVISLQKSADKFGIPFKRPPRNPIMARHLLCLCNNLDLTSPFGAAVWAAALVAFWGCRRLGELLPSSTAFSPSRHVSSSSNFKSSFVNGCKVITFHIPCTKTSPTGIQCILTATNNLFCPVTALENHLCLNRPSSSSHLFAFRNDTSPTTLTKSLFLSTTSKIFLTHSLDPVFGHSYRIGGVIELLATGVPPEVIMKLGGWSSLCFLLYWRRLDFLVPNAIT
ncbi:hypothetical protein D9615_002403 [Tricholomella constricta]|uniref:Uncharacterized protein n=1 Tax=Tricholomella constricta TaxID=117010 RepID=A0A8H5HMJ5_9AGAR|nr:hypothetical protein D9615_002403 [Tricholomella constricta]